MKKILLAFVLIGFLLLLTSCIFTSYRTADRFYTSTGAWDSVRFPLIRPYEAVAIVGGNGWGINLPVILGEPTLYGSVQDVQKISIVDNVILVYTPSRPDISPEMLDQIDIYYWYVIVPDKKIQRGFGTNDDFQNYILKLGIKDVIWENPDDLFQEFENTGCLEWIPECQ